MTNLIYGDCLDAMRSMPDNSVDSIVTDPPYGLRFMGKKWDYDVPAVEVWAECLRVLKPGGHLLAFAGTRTQHRMAVRIEDAGFEIRDMIAWVYGSGFPKSLDVSKAIDRAAGAEGRRGPMKRGGERLARLEDGKRDGEGRWGDEAGRDPYTYLPFTPEAQQWAGWGTALKPALEPITVARKPLIGTVAENVLTHGTGALNIDRCRVDASEGRPLIESKAESSLHAFGDGLNGSRCAGVTTQGRFPANLIHDGSDEVLAGFPVTTSGKPMNKMHTDPGRNVASGASEGGEYFHTGYGDSGSAARFFYCAKTSKTERGKGNNHPTVKPTDLMRYLCRLVTPPDGIVLDPFMGSGSTGKAARLEGFRFIGIERDEAYFQIAKTRIKISKS